MSLDVGSGKYAFLCLVQDFDPRPGPTVIVGGHAAGARAIAVMPVPNHGLGEAINDRLRRAAVRR